MIDMFEMTKKIGSAVRDLRRPRDGSVYQFGPKRPDETWYVITFDGREGFYTAFHHVMLHIRVACVSGMTPVVDTVRYPSPCCAPWEAIFEQPTDECLDDVYESRRVMMAPPVYLSKVCSLLSEDYIESSEDIASHRALISSRMRLSRKMAVLADSERDRVLSYGRSVAVVCPDEKDDDGGLLQPEGDLLLRHAVGLIGDGGAETCYLIGASEDDRAMFRAELGDRLIDGITADAAGPHEISIAETFAAASCCALISGMNHRGITAIEINNDKYKIKDIINCGYYK